MVARHRTLVDDDAWVGTRPLTQSRGGHQAAGLDVFNDIDGLLALVDCCDAVLTSSNVTAHLAGSLAKPGVVLVPTGKGSLWYWQGGSNDLWYPSLRRVPQDRAGHWEAAIQTAVALVKDIL